ncbi:hypothetical protein HDR58_06450 [bacterium]|nr:hypothetical protein [bacterium]
MKIDNYTNNHTNFGTSYRKVIKPSYQLGDCYEASTYFFVKGLQWNKFFNHLIEKYKDTPKVNVFSLACSDGSEAYSIAMLLISKLGEDKAKKYFPIIAVDFDRTITRNARKGYMNISQEDELSINKYTGNKLNLFFERTNQTFLSDNKGSTKDRDLLTRFKINPILKDKVQFITEDLNTYVDKMPTTNNLIFCRNCWPYLWKTSKEFAQKLSTKTDINSYLVLGNFDRIGCPMNTKNCYGFSMNKEFPNVLDKSGSDFFDNTRLFFTKIEDDI